MNDIYLNDFLPVDWSDVMVVEAQVSSFSLITGLDGREPLKYNKCYKLGNEYTFNPNVFMELVELESATF